MKNSAEIRQCIEFLNELGWSELIDSRWTLEVQKALEENFPYFDKEVITSTLDTIMYPEPNYNVDDNEKLL